MSGRCRRKFQESCCKRRQNGSELSQQSTKHERFDQKQRREWQLQSDPCWLLRLLNSQLKQTVTQPSVQVLTGELMRANFILINSVYILGTVVQNEVLLIQTSISQLMSAVYNCTWAKQCSAFLTLINLEWLFLSIHAARQHKVKSFFSFNIPFRWFLHRCASACSRVCEHCFVPG